MGKSPELCGAGMLTVSDRPFNVGKFFKFEGT